jgi:ribosomal protein S18 acetylase RimI-like enzyme
MSAEDDALRDMAVNRGCRLVKSRRRKPGGDFGRYGLKDAKTGREVFGFGERGLTASAEEIQRFLRGGTAAEWKRSLIAPADKAPPPPTKRKHRKAAGPKKASRNRVSEAAGPKAARGKASAEEKPKPRRGKPETPPPTVREAKPADSQAISGLLVELGYEVGPADVRRRLQTQRKAGNPVLVAERARVVVGCLSWHVTPVIHRPRPVGRITMLVVAEAARGEGIGTLLVEDAAERLRTLGCGLLEVTSNIKRMRAHAFYQGLGFERTSYRFARTLQE